MHSIGFVITTLIICILFPHPVSARTTFGSLMKTSAHTANTVQANTAHALPIPTTAPAVLGTTTFIGPIKPSIIPTAKNKITKELHHYCPSR